MQQLDVKRLTTINMIHQPGSILIKSSAPPAWNQSSEPAPRDDADTPHRTALLRQRASATSLSMVSYTLSRVTTVRGSLLKCHTVSPVSLLTRLNIPTPDLRTGTPSSAGLDHPPRWASRRDTSLFILDVRGLAGTAEISHGAAPMSCVITSTWRRCLAIRIDSRYPSTHRYECQL